MRQINIDNTTDNSELFSHLGLNPNLIIVDSSSDVEPIRQITKSSGSYITYQNFSSILKPVTVFFSFPNEINTPKDQLQALRFTIGFNISELANILLVKRPTIYEWLDSE